MRGDDPAGSVSGEAPEVMVDSVRVVSGMPTRVMVAHGDLSGPGATPTISYDQATSAAGRLVAEGQAGLQVASFTGEEVGDGIPPRLVGDPELVGWTHGHPETTTPPANYGNQDAIRFTFDEPISRDSAIRQVLVSVDDSMNQVMVDTIANGKFNMFRSPVIRTDVPYHNFYSGEAELSEETSITSRTAWLPAAPVVLGAHLARGVQVRPMHA